MDPLTCLVVALALVLFFRHSRSQSSVRSAKRTCPVCDHPLRRGSYYCAECGTRLDGIDA
jgi:predicted amidophosphoribosyltransferase